MVAKTKTSRKYNSSFAYRGRRLRSRLARKHARKNLVKTVKSVVASLTEDKQAYTSSGNSLIKFNSGIDSTADIQPILPAIGQGVDTHQRVGETIIAKTLNIRGHIKLDINDVSDSTKLPNVAVRMLIVSIKNRPSYDQATASAAPLATLLKKGGTTTGFTGTLSDLHAPINRDVFTVHHDKKYYLKQDYLNGIGASIPSQYVTSDVSKTVRFFNLNVKCKGRKLMYDEDVASDVYPVNFSPFLVLGYCYLDGSTPDVVDTKVGLAYDSVFTFEDA